MGGVGAEELFLNQYLMLDTFYIKCIATESHLCT